MTGTMPTKELPPGARSVLEELKGLLDRVYADMDVSRDRVRQVAERGMNIAEEAAWPGGEKEEQLFRDNLMQIETKIYQTLDLKRLREEGLVKAVRF